jgi:hypothetical protein
MPGVTSVLNASGKPEAVLTNPQWNKLADKDSITELQAEIRYLGDRLERVVSALPRQHRDLTRQGTGRAG